MGVPFYHLSKSTTVWTGMESITVIYRGGQGTNIRVPHKYGVFFKGEKGMNLRVPHKYGPFFRGENGMNSDSSSRGRFHQHLRDICSTEICPAPTIQQLEMLGSLNIYIYIFIYLFISSLVMVPFPARSRKFSFLQSLGDHQASYSIGTRGLFLGDKLAKA